MNRSGLGDVLKIFVYLGVVLCAAAVISPWLYSFGKGLAEIFQTKETNPLVQAAADGARGADFPIFFRHALILSAIALLLPLVYSLRFARSRERPSRSPWTLHLPRHAIARPAGQPLRRDPQGAMNAFVGFLLGASLLLLYGYVLTLAGTFEWRPDPAWARAFRRAIPLAAGIALISEIAFRGVILGIFLRAMRPFPAAALASLLFTFVFFLRPGEGVVLPDPESHRAGWLLLGEILASLLLPECWAAIATVFAAGLLLADARLRTAALWLPTGLHGGWLFGIFLFQEAAVRSAGGANSLAAHEPTVFLIPLAVILVTAFLVRLLTVDHEPMPS